MKHRIKWFRKNTIRFRHQTDIQAELVHSTLFPIQIPDAYDSVHGIYGKKITGI